ncbi:MAG: arsenate reductase (glutaredoxin) [Gammaproteobacteria bacterium]|nr:arsenate reductase (glutaredoxin) [Gammaproteobacteria bacterium]
MTVSILHNPRCSKSRATLALLDEHDVKVDVILYLEDTPSVDELKSIISKLGIEAHELIRFNESVAGDLGIKTTDERSQQEWIELMVNNPILIERPVVISSDKAAIGRPPENVLDII